MVVLPLTLAQTAWGQGTTQAEPTKPDSTVVPWISFQPIYTTGIDGNVTSVGMKHELSNTSLMSNGFRILSRMATEEKHFRLQDRRESNKTLTNSVFKQLTQSISLDFTQTDSRINNRIISPGGRLDDFIINNQSVASGIHYNTIQPQRVRWDSHVSGSFTDSEKTFKTDKTWEGKANGGIGVTVLNDFVIERLVVRVRGYYRETTEDAFTADSSLTDLGASEDSVSAVVIADITDSLSLDASYARFTGTRRYADQARSAFGTQQSTVEGEVEDSRNESLNITMRSRILPSLDMRASAEHSESKSLFDNASNRNSQITTDALRGDINYSLGTKTVVTSKLETRKTERNLFSVSSYDETRLRFDLGLSQIITQTFRVDVAASNQLSQTVYPDPTNNRDRDQLDQSLNVRLNSQPFSKINANISMTIGQTDFINIDENTEDNREKLRVDMRPNITYRMNERVTITQSYGLAIERTQYVFNDPALAAQIDDDDIVIDDDFLDRTITFSNEVNTSLTNRIRANFYYALNFHDRGTYLPDPEANNERKLDVEREDRTDRLRTRWSYTLNDHLRLLGEYEYSRKRDTTVGTDRSRITKDARLQGGVQGNYKWGSGRELQFSLVRVGRDSPFATGKQKDFWEARSQFKYSF